MSIVIGFPDRRAPQLRPEILDLLEHEADTVEIALEHLARAERPADVIARVFRAGVSYGRRSQQNRPDPQAAAALHAIDELAARRAQRGGDAS